MNDEIQTFFVSEPEALRLYQLLEEKVLGEWNTMKRSPVEIKVQKTQITFKNPRSFASAWVPIHRVKNRPEHYIVVTFGLPVPLESPRITESAEIRPGRWTHHVIISKPEEVDEELMGWIQSSYEYSLQPINRKDQREVDHAD